MKWSINGQSAMRISGMVCNEQTGQLFVGYISGDLIAYDLQTGEVQKLLLHAPVGISHLAHKSEQELIVCLFNGEMHQICCDNPDCKMVYKVASSSRL